MVISKNNLLNKEFDMRSTLFYPSHPMLDDMVQEFFGNAFGNTKAVSKYPLTDVYTKDGVAYLEIAIAGFSKDFIPTRFEYAISGTKLHKLIYGRN